MNKLVQSIVLFTLLLILSSAPSPVLAQTPPPPEAQTFQGDQFIMGDNYELRENQTLNGNLVVLGGNGNYCVPERQGDQFCKEISFSLGEMCLS